MLVEITAVDVELGLVDVVEVDVMLALLVELETSMCGTCWWRF